MKKLIGIILLLALVLTLAACQDGATQSAESESEFPTAEIASSMEQSADSEQVDLETIRAQILGEWSSVEKREALSIDSDTFTHRTYVEGNIENEYGLYEFGTYPFTYELYVDSANGKTRYVILGEIIPGDSYEISPRFYYFDPDVPDQITEEGSQEPFTRGHSDELHNRP